MLTEILILLVSCLLLFPLNDGAYLVLGSLEVKDSGAQNENRNETTKIQAKALPKREYKVSREKQKSKLVTSKIEDDVEIIEQIPYCTNLFKSSICAKEKKNSIDNKIKVPGENVNEGKPGVNNYQDHVVDINKNTNVNEKTFNNSSVIEKLKRELAKEREKVRSLTNELNSVKNVCDDSYDDEELDFTSYSEDRVQATKPSVDLYNLISAKKENDKLRDTPKSRTLNENMKLLSNLTRSKIKDEFNQAFLNEDRINKDLFKDNVYQIPNFSFNNQKSYKNPLFTGDLSILNQNSMGYRNIPLPETNILPYKESNVHEDILKTLYPQFFIEEFGDVVDISNLKRGSGRSLIEPGQIYANNMKQLTAPYKIFPGHMNPDFRYYNIRDRRNDPHCISDNQQNEKLNHDVYRCLRSNFTTDLKKFLNKDSLFMPNSFFKTKENVSNDSAFKIKGGILKLQESTDGDDSSKENYFESSKDGEPQKNDEIYNRLLTKYLKRIKNFKLDEMSGAKELGTDNGELEEEEPTEEFDKPFQKETGSHVRKTQNKNSDNTNQKGIELYDRKTLNKNAIMKSLLLKQIQRVNGTNQSQEIRSEESSSGFDLSDEDEDDNSGIENNHPLSQINKQIHVKDIENSDENDLFEDFNKKEKYSVKGLKENDDEALKENDDDKCTSVKASRKQANSITKCNDSEDNLISKKAYHDTEDLKLKKKAHHDTEDLKLTINEEEDDEDTDKDENNLTNESTDSENELFHRNNKNQIVFLKDSHKEVVHSPKTKRNREENLDVELSNGHQTKRNMKKNRINKVRKSGRNHDSRCYKQKLL